VLTTMGGLFAASRRNLVVSRAGEHCWGELMLASLILILKTNVSAPASRIATEARFGLAWSYEQREVTAAFWSSH
jgi:hypothetical protein